MIYITVGVVIVLTLCVWLLFPLETTEKVGLTTAISTVALAFVTSIYAWHTRKMADEMNKQAEIMVNTEFNAVAPVMQLLAADSVTKDRRTVRIYWKNVGKGPALNFRCWIHDPENQQLRSLGKTIYRTAVAVDISPDKGDFSNFVKIDTEIENYKLQLSHACIRAQYESVFGKTYESSLHFPTNAAPELKYGEATEIIIL